MRRSAFTAKRSGAVAVAGTKTITSPGTPKSARSTSGTIAEKARGAGLAVRGREWRQLELCPFLKISDR